MRRLIPLFIIAVMLFLTVNSYAYKDSTFYYQSNPEWEFENSGRGYCWVCCYAMIINNITGASVTPPDIAYVNSLHNDDPAICYHSDIINAFGMEFEAAVPENSPYFGSFDEHSGRTVLKAESEEEMRNALREALSLNPEGITVRFEGSLVHTMVATYYDSDFIYFSDPGFKENASDITFNQTYNGKNGYKLTDIQCVQAIKGEKREISVYIDSEKTDFEDKPIIKKGRVMVPMRIIFEKLGAEVSWFDEIKTAKIEKDGSTVELIIGHDCLYKDWKKYPLDISPELINSKTYVPVRAIGEAFGYNINWDSETATVYIQK